MKKHLELTLLTSLLSLASFQATASSLEVDLNSDAIKAKYNLNSEKADIGLAVAALITDDNGDAFSFDIKSQGALNNSSNPNIRGGFGVRAYHVSYEDDSFQALAIGGFGEYTLSSDISLSFELYYAPSITMTDDLDSMHEIMFRASYQLFENAKIYTGIRDLEVDDFDIDDEIHIGFELDL